MRSESYSVSLRDLCRYYSSRLEVSRARGRIFRSFANKGNTGQNFLLGQYHGRNVGDLALGYSLLDSVKSKHRVVLWGKDNKYAGNASIILGGGSVLNFANIQYMIRSEIDPTRVVAIGVDCESGFYGKPSAELEYVSKFSHLSLRSSQAYQALIDANVFSPDRLSYNFDNAFSLFPDVIDTPVQSGRIGINMLPHLWKLRNRCFRVEGRFAKRLAAKHDVDRIAQNYIQIFRDLVGQRVDQGKTVVHVPFCAEDDLFARVALRGLDVQFQKFVPDVNCVIQQVARCEAFVATRYHALVFALGCGRPVFTVAYASKSQNLLDDIGVPQDAYITNKDLELNDSVQLPEFDSEAAKYFTLGQPERLKLSNDVRAHLNELLLLGE